MPFLFPGMVQFWMEPCDTTKASKTNKTKSFWCSVPLWSKTRKSFPGRGKNPRFTLPHFDLTFLGPVSVPQFGSNAFSLSP